MTGLDPVIIKPPLKYRSGYFCSGWPDEKPGHLRESAPLRGVALFERTVRLDHCLLLIVKTLRRCR